MVILRIIRALRSHPTSTVWGGSLVVSIFAISSLSLWTFTGVVPVAIAAENSLDSIRSTSPSTLNTGASSGLAQLQGEVNELRRRTSSIANFVRWLDSFSPAVSWIPGAGPEISAWAKQTNRIESDLEAASKAFGASRRLLNVYNSAPSALVNFDSPETVDLMRQQAELSGQEFASTLSLLNENSSTRPSGVLFNSPFGSSYTNRMRDLENELRTGAELGMHVSGIVTDLLAISEGVAPFMAGSSGQADASQQIEIDSLAQSLRSVVFHVDSARNKSAIVSTIVTDSGQGGEYLNRLVSLDVALEAMGLIGQGSLRTVEVVGPAMSGVEGRQGGLFSEQGGLFKIFDSVHANSSEIDIAIGEFERAERLLLEFDPVSLGMSTSSFSNMITTIEDLRVGLTLVRDVSPVADRLLGMNSPTRFLVLGQSSDELRATGGFVSSLWMVTFDRGALADIKYYDAVRVDDWDRFDFYPTAPVGLEEHMNGWVWLLRDVSWDPDFPTTARTAKDLFRLGQHQDVDGVVAINQWTFLKLIDALGEIPTPDGSQSITSKNFLEVLEEGTDVHGRAYMDLVLQGVLDNLNGGMSLTRLTSVASSLFESIDTRDTLVFFDDPTVQQSMANLGWDGGMVDTPGDYLFVADSNVGWSKVDRNIEREVTYVVDLGRENSPRATLTLEYTNHSGPDSQPCEPQWISRGTDYGQLKNACYWNYFRTYIPQESRILSTPKLPLSPLSVSVEIGKGHAGQDTGTISSSHNKTVYSGLTAVDAGEEKRLMLVYDLPKRVITDIEGQLRYDLYIQKQPGVISRNVEIEVVPPDDYSLVSSSTPPTFSNDTNIGFSFNLTRDTELSLLFAPTVSEAR